MAFSTFPVEVTTGLAVRYNRYPMAIITTAAKDRNDLNSRLPADILNDGLIC
jgi:hypothetical protein